MAVADLPQERSVGFFGVASGRPGDEELALPEPAVAQRVGLERGAVFGGKIGGADFGHAGSSSCGGHGWRGMGGE